MFKKEELRTLDQIEIDLTNWIDMFEEEPGAFYHLRVAALMLQDHIIAGRQRAELIARGYDPDKGKYDYDDDYNDEAVCECSQCRREEPLGFAVYMPFTPGCECSGCRRQEGGE